MIFNSYLLDTLFCKNDKKKLTIHHYMTSKNIYN